MPRCNLGVSALDAVTRSLEMSRRIVVQTIKTAIVVVLLLGVCYGAYVAINAPDPVLPPELDGWANGDNIDLKIDEGTAFDIPQLSNNSPDFEGLTPPNLSGGNSTANPSSTGLPQSNNVAANSLAAPPTLNLPDSKGTTKPEVSKDASAKSADLSLPDASKLSNNPASGLGNDVPKLPDLSLPPGVEGTSIPLPGASLATSSLPGSGVPSGAPVSTLASTGGTTNNSPLPEFPGLPSKDAANTPSGSNGFSLPGEASPPATNAATATASAAGATGASNSAPKQTFTAAREQAIKLANDGKLRDALALMSPYFNHIELTHEEHLDLIDLLDALAGEVIYSKRHFLESPFIVAAGDTLEAIANKYQISPETLAAINRMGDSKVVLAGTQMKVLRGPFRGEVNLTRGELTLFLGDLYAGRFPISVGKEPTPTEGTYKISDRRRDRSYVGSDSKFMPASDPRNPYGGYWMHLGNDICIHGSPASTSPEMEGAGCISLAPLDAKEVYSLLTQGSEITIKR